MEIQVFFFSVTSLVSYDCSPMKMICEIEYVNLLYFFRPKTEISYHLLDEEREREIDMEKSMCLWSVLGALGVCLNIMYYIHFESHYPLYLTVAFVVHSHRR